MTTETVAADRTAGFFDRYARDFDAIYGTRNTPLNRAVNTLFRRSMRQRYLLTLEGCHPVTGRSVVRSALRQLAFVAVPAAFVYGIGSVVGVATGWLDAGATSPT